MWRLSQKSEDQHYDHYPVDLDHVQTGISQCVHSLPRSASSSEITSPTPSYFSKMQSTRPGSTGSSVASSPTMRESLDTFTPQRTLLTDVKEEPQERDDVEAVNAVRALPSRLFPTSSAIEDMLLTSFQGTLAPAGGPPRSSHL